MLRFSQAHIASKLWNMGSDLVPTKPKNILLVSLCRMHDSCPQKTYNPTEEAMEPPPNKMKRT
jgi:hypothetical protein